MSINLTQVNLKKLKQDNPYYWQCLLDGCKYDESEILNTINSIDVVNNEWQEFVDKVWDTVLTDELGVMGGIDGYASDAHKEIAIALGEGNKVRATDSYGGHYALPVRRWQNEVKNLHKLMRKIQKMVDKL